MRFGTFVFSISHDPQEDHWVIENTLREVELAEAIGMDAVWLTEHHFDGAVAYADPVVFGAKVGFVEGTVEKALDETWAQRALYVADSDDEALAVETEALKRYRHHLDESRRRYNPGGLPARKPGTPQSPNEMVEHAFLAGTPKRVAERIAALKEAGVRNLLLGVSAHRLHGEELPSQGGAEMMRTGSHYSSREGVRHCGAADDRIGLKEADWRVRRI